MAQTLETCQFFCLISCQIQEIESISLIIFYATTCIYEYIKGSFLVNDFS